MSKLKYQLLKYSLIVSLLSLTACQNKTKELPVISLDHLDIINHEENNLLYEDYLSIENPMYQYRNEENEDLINFYIDHEGAINDLYNALSNFNGKSLHNNTHARYYYDEADDFVLAFDEYGTMIYAKDIVLYKSNQSTYQVGEVFNGNYLVIKNDCYIIITSKEEYLKKYQAMKNNIDKSDHEVSKITMNYYGYKKLK